MTEEKQNIFKIKKFCSLFQNVYIELNEPSIFIRNLLRNDDLF